MREPARRDTPRFSEYRPIQPEDNCCPSQGFSIWEGLKWPDILHERIGLWSQ